MRRNHLLGFLLAITALADSQDETMRELLPPEPPPPPKPVRDHTRIVDAAERKRERKRAKRRALLEGS